MQGQGSRTLGCRGHGAAELKQVQQAHVHGLLRDCREGARGVQHPHQQAQVAIACCKETRTRSPRARRLCRTQETHQSKIARGSCCIAGSHIRAAALGDQPHLQVGVAEPAGLPAGDGVQGNEGQPAGVRQAVVHPHRLPQLIPPDAALLSLCGPPAQRRVILRQHPSQGVKLGVRWGHPWHVCQLAGTPPKAGGAAGEQPF